MRVLMEAKNVTIATVAKLAGVSAMTVSRVMNKSPYVRVDKKKSTLFDRHI